VAKMQSLKYKGRWYVWWTWALYLF